MSKFFDKIIDTAKGALGGIKNRINAHFDKVVIFYPTYAYRDPADGRWTVPARVWVRRRRALPVGDDRVRELFGEGGPIGEAEVLRLRATLEDFVANDSGRDRVSFTFDGLSGRPYVFEQVTSPNGLVEQEFKLHPEDEAALGDAGGAESLWRSVSVRAEGVLGAEEGDGRVVFPAAQGLSVVSDIDDTIKVTEILAGPPTFLRRTFLMDYEAVAGMKDRYERILETHGDHRDVVFHYVSGGPWPLYRQLGKFLIADEKFPEGTFHMKEFSKSLLDPESFVEDMRNLAAGQSHTEDMKVAIIEELMRRLPGRRFVLFGDSGEADPEAFARVRSGEFGGRVEKVYIRDVRGDGRDSERLRPTEVIDP